MRHPANIRPNSQKSKLKSLLARDFLAAAVNTVTAVGCGELLANKGLIPEERARVKEKMG